MHIHGVASAASGHVQELCRSVTVSGEMEPLSEECVVTTEVGSTHLVEVPAFAANV